MVMLFTICAHPPKTILFKQQNDYNMTHALLNLYFVHQFFNLSLDLLYLVRVGKDTIYGASIWYSITLRGGNPLGISFRNTSLNSCKRESTLGGRLI